MSLFLRYYISSIGSKWNYWTRGWQIAIKSVLTNINNICCSQRLFLRVVGFKFRPSTLRGCVLNLSISYAFVSPSENKDNNSLLLCTTYSLLCNIATKLWFKTIKLNYFKFLRVRNLGAA